MIQLLNTGTTSVLTHTMLLVLTAAWGIARTTLLPAPVVAAAVSSTVKVYPLHLITLSTER